MREDAKMKTTALTETKTYVKKSGSTLGQQPNAHADVLGDQIQPIQD